MRSRRLTSLLIGGFVLVQLLLPLRGLLQDKFDTWGGFTWNMYSQTYECRARYQLLDGPSAGQTLDLGRYFIDPSKVGLTLNREQLPTLHAFLCAQIYREDRPGRISARVSCTRNRVETRSLVREGVDICGARDRGVIGG